MPRARRGSKASATAATSVKFPADLLARASDPDVAAIVDGERKLFELRRNARVGQKAQLRQRIEQLNEEIRGLQAQRESKEKEIKLIERELEGVHDLWKQKLVPLTKLTELEREAARLEGEAGQLIAQTAQAGGKIAETELQIIQIDRDLSSEVAKETREIDGKIGEFVERKVTAEDQLKRIDIRAPQDGTVFQSTVHTVGGVITAGDAIMLIVPDADNLTVEAKVNPQDIDQVQIGQNALLRLSAFNQRTTPEINGTVTRISADTSTDQRTGQSYYTIRIAMPPEEVARLGDVKIVPGMPVEAFVQTGERTMLSYLVKPLQRPVHANVPGEVTGKTGPIERAPVEFDMTWLVSFGAASSAPRGHCAWRCCSRCSSCASPIRPASRSFACGHSTSFRSSSRASHTQRPVVIVDIDEQSLRKLGQWPWPRTRVADLITRLTKLGALVIAFDVVFAEPDRLSPQLAADVFRDLDEETRNKLRALPSNDQVMADAMRQSKVVLGETGLPTIVPQSDAQPPSAGVAALGGDPKPFLFSFPGLLRNIPVLDKAAAGRGLFSIRSERDGIVRRVPMVMLAQGNDHAFADLRDAARGDRLQHHFDQDRTRPESRALRFPGSKCRPIATASCGFISRRTIRHATFPPSTCSKGA